MFTFPRDPARRKTWAAKVRRENWCPTNSSALCSEHFEPSQFQANARNDKIVLCKSAVPTIFSHVKASEPRRPPKRRLQEEEQERLVTAVHEDHFYTNSEPVESPVHKKLHSDITVQPPLDGPEIEVQTLSHELHQQLVKVAQLQQEIDALKKELKEKKCPCSKIFGEDQLQHLRVGTVRGKGYSWSDKTVMSALKLRFSCGASGYEDLLQLGFPLPALSTLHRKTEHIAFESGILTEVFPMLQDKVRSLNEKERWCGLSMDEMSIKKSIDYDMKSDAFMGYVTLPEHHGEATKAFCFQLAGPSTRWKQIIGYFFTGNSVNGKVVGPIVNDILERASRIGLKVACMTNDFGSSNLVCWA